MLTIIGAGFYGLTMARLAAENGHTAHVIEKRNHIGGNSWSEIDETTGIEFHKYGTHLFHTNNERVWSFVNRFGTFNDYRHRVFTSHLGRLYEMPPTLQEISWFFQGATSPERAKDAISKDAVLEDGESPEDNFETKAVSLVGRTIYDSLIRGYTEKQWQTDPRLLPASVISRLPFHLSFNSGYFKDKYRGIPRNGYGQLLTSIAQHPNIEVTKEIDFFSKEFRHDFRNFTVFTGPIDRFFEYQHGMLGWRTLDFEFEIINQRDFQGTPVVNYADTHPSYTRIHEFKHLHPERKSTLQSKQTLIAREFSRKASEQDEPYYPINSSLDIENLEKYQTLAESLPNVHFGGRLGTYRYLDMHMAIASAMNDWDSVVAPKLSTKI